jgi:hypothetical protein
MSDDKILEKTHTVGGELQKRMAKTCELRIFKGTVAWDFWSRFFHESTPNRSLMNFKK